MLDSQFLLSLSGIFESVSGEWLSNEEEESGWETLLLVECQASESREITIAEDAAEWIFGVDADDS